MRRAELLFLILISLSFFLLMYRDIDSWYYSAIGDEYAFFETAQKIALGETKISFFPSAGSLSLLDQKGVYGIVPVAVSVYQAFVMKIFGVNHQGWLTSSILSVIFSFWPLYFGIKEVFNKRVAIFSLLIFASSHYLWAYSHTGYWNILAYFPAIATFYLVVVAFKRQGPFFWFLSGVSSGFCFYIHYYAGISVFLITLFLVIQRKKIRISNLIAFYTGFLILFLPYLLVNLSVALKVISGRTLVESGEIPQGKRVVYFFSNLLNSFLSFFTNKGVVHFVSGSLLDSLTGLLFFLGLGSILVSFRKYYFLLIVLLVLLVFLGGFSQYTYTPISRLYFILPVVALIAGVGLDKLLRLLEKLFPHSCSLIAVLSILIFLFGLNFYRFYYQTPKIYQTTVEAVAIKAFKELCINTRTALIDKYPEPVLQPAVLSYGFPNNPEILRVEDIRPSGLSRYNCLILVRPSDPQIALLSNEIEKSSPLRRKSFVSDLTGKSTVFVYY